MINIILCEGFDEVYLLGYYLYKTAGWKYTKDGKLSVLFDVPKLESRNQKIEIYERNDDRTAIWSIGGKDSLEIPFHFISKVNKHHPSHGIKQVFILMDRDRMEIQDCLNQLEIVMRKMNLPIDDLKNNQSNILNYEIENEVYQLHIIPVVIPFDQEGAIETILMSSIASKNDECRFIVDHAKQYVSSCRVSGKVSNYLKSNREQLKAEFSSVISITNPDRSTVLFNDLLMSTEWEMSKEIQEHFQVFCDLMHA